MRYYEEKEKPIPCPEIEFPVPDVNEYFAGNKNVKTVYQLGGQCVLWETNETKKLKLKRVDPISRLNTRRPGSIVNHIREWPFEEGSPVVESTI
ncbi:hypothetical protein HZH66_007661 [Vespula vulgaris]|uniref:Uncharacterized protein n=1 Tax=Vespula vulgaris TaxID=7454 RepID=A0A834N6H9_VESVU|nr:hypothetical protein HZH66_007661 [Vespula vulgaris]